MKSCVKSFISRPFFGTLKEINYFLISIHVWYTLKQLFTSVSMKVVEFLLSGEVLTSTSVIIVRYDTQLLLINDQVTKQSIKLAAP